MLVAWLKIQSLSPVQNYRIMRFVDKLVLKLSKTKEVIKMVRFSINLHQIFAL